MMVRRTVPAVLIAALSLFAGSVLIAQTDIERHPDCTRCGMDRKAYGYSRMLVQYADGSEAGVCSLHCAVSEQNADPGRPVKALLVADRDDRSLLNAEQAVWVSGGAKRGVMTQVPVWAFATASAADAFIARYGGKITAWPEVVAAARKEVETEGR